MEEEEIFDLEGEVDENEIFPEVNESYLYIILAELPVLRPSGILQI